MFLKPWIGEKYHQGINNEKILIFGESHYFGETFDNTQVESDLTPKALSEIIENRKKYKFFINIGHMFFYSIYSHFFYFCDFFIQIAFCQEF